MAEIIAVLTEYLGKLFGKASASFVVVVIVAITLGQAEFIDTSLVEIILTAMLIFALGDVIYKYIIRAINDTRLMFAKTKHKIDCGEFGDNGDTMKTLSKNVVGIVDGIATTAKNKVEIKKLESEIEKIEDKEKLL